MPLQQNTWVNPSILRVLQKGGVVVMPTDTIYGIVGKALDPTVVERIYTIRKRAPEKSCIVLIGDMGELEKFSIDILPEQENVIKNFSTPTSFILDCQNENLKYLHRGTDTLAFRIPLQEELRNLLIKTGPLIAPSANPEGLSPAKDITEAREYFGEVVDLYIDGGEIKREASKVVKLHKDGTIGIIRP